MTRTRLYFDVLSVGEYINKPLAGLSIADYIASEAVQRAEEKGVDMPSTAQVIVTFIEGHFMVEIFVMKEEERKLCTPATLCGTFAL